MENLKLQSKQIFVDCENGQGHFVDDEADSVNVENTLLVAYSLAVNLSYDTDHATHEHEGYTYNHKTDIDITDISVISLESGEVTVNVDEELIKKAIINSLIIN